MSRTTSELVAALAAGAAALSGLISSSDEQGFPPNLRTATDILSTYATDAAEFASVVASTPAGDTSGIVARLDTIDVLLKEAGITTEAKPAPAPAPAADPATPAA